MTFQSLTFSGVPEGFDAKLLAAEAENGGVIHIARDASRMSAMQAALSFCAPQLRVFIFPAWDCLPYDRLSPNTDISAQRMAALTSFLEHMPSSYVVLSTLSAVAQRLPPKQTLEGYHFSADVQTRVDENNLRQILIKMGFSKTSTVVEPGDYAVRGGIIDVFPAGQDHPLRLDFFGDVLDGVRQFDVNTQRTLKHLKKVMLSPVSELLLDSDTIALFRQNYRAQFGAAGADNPLYEAISNNIKPQGAEHFSPLFYPSMDTLFEYLPDATVLLDEHIDAIHNRYWETITDQYDARTEAGQLAKKTAPRSHVMPPEQLYIAPDALPPLYQNRRNIQLCTLPQPVGQNTLDYGARTGRNFAPERKQQDVHLFEELAHYINSLKNDFITIIACYSEGSRERLSKLLQDEDLIEQTLIGHLDEARTPGVYLAVFALEHGYKTDTHVLISEQDILGERLIRRAHKRRRADNFLTEVQSLSIGDLVVHVDHGIGRFAGTEVIVIGKASHECLHLEYAENAKLYLPVENIELLSRYGHEDAPLDRLGGGAWQAKKAAAKKRIKDMAQSLIRVAAERELRGAPVFDRPDGIWESFAARFPFQETEDQLLAIEDVLGDLTRGRPMDRLICGDVGFGKTEVAMRAAFVAALAGMQVAIIAPTTLLARQHSLNFTERFRSFPVNVRQLSRFVGAKEAAQTKDGLAQGSVDVVIGTHAVLAKNICFKKLGLLIIDEEQRFGVAHKERLKQMRTDVHVLTLTATPIPRTLQLSLSGVRDLSVIATPPMDRMAVRTYVSDFDPVTIREALLREHYRGGQSFFVVPKIKDIEDIEVFLQEQVPEVKYTVVHGQMAAGVLDDKMNAFYDGKFDVLLSTTIVESGLDIPNANTIIIHHADMFGLAQLYQIRGRVGRSKIRAFAYLTTRPRKVLTPTARKRLRVLGTLDTLGAGFSLAAQDLDIRGAGNLLGQEQSGQMRDVGYELYQHMLEDAVAALKAGTVEDLTQNDQWAPQIDLGVSVLIPENYVPHLDVRLSLYRRLSGLESKVELEGFAAELIDRFGPLPKEINTLLLIIRIKAICRRAGILKLDGGIKGATVQFYRDKYASPAGLMKFIEDQDGLAKMRGHKLIIRRDWRKMSDRLKGAYAIAQDLAMNTKV